MNRSWPNRTCALLWAVLFLLKSAGGGFGLSPCPHHDHGSGAPGEQAGAPSAHHAGHAGAATDAGAPAGPESHPGACTCVGACPAGLGAQAPLAEETRVSFPLAVVEAVRPLQGASDHRPSGPPPYFLPYGLAPPARG